MPLNLFVRQPFTESGPAEQAKAQAVMELLGTLDGSPYGGLKFLTWMEAQEGNSFKEKFERESGESFTAQHFRDYRLSLLDRADGFINIRVGLSESSAFEIAYHIFKGRRTPIFFAVAETAPMKTTLLRDLEDLCPATYVTFREAEELREPLLRYLSDVARYLGK